MYQLIPYSIHHFLISLYTTSTRRQGTRHCYVSDVQYTFSCAFLRCWPHWKAFHRTCTWMYCSPFSHGSSCALSVLNSGHKNMGRAHTYRAFLQYGFFGVPLSLDSSGILFHSTRMYHCVHVLSDPCAHLDQILRQVVLFGLKLWWHLAPYEAIEYQEVKMG